MFNLDTVRTNKKLTIEDCYLTSIPEDIYQKIVGEFSADYHFNNGERMRIANYFVSISQSLADELVDFIKEVYAQRNEYPDVVTPDGFEPFLDNLSNNELDGGFSLGSFDMAVTDEGLRNIEFQAVATYPISAAKLNHLLVNFLSLGDVELFADKGTKSWEDFICLYRQIIGGGQEEGVILVDRKIKEQKTNFEFYATQKELGISIDIVDMKDVYEEEGRLYYLEGEEKKVVRQFYNRILLAEALFEDDYPNAGSEWKFRFDEFYKDLKYVNHPVKQFDISKRLTPYIDHSFNPKAYELGNVIDSFKNGTLKYEDYIWKHKWGAAGHKLYFMPTAATIEELGDSAVDYIAQKKVNFKIFKTADGLEKIIELRFMTASYEGQINIVPMARIGRVERLEDGRINYKIHFGDNNQEGYGFAPVVIVNDK